jgi:hypothetical protein
MLVTKDMEKGCNIFGDEVFQHEGLVAETHFLKLHLLARFLLKAHGVTLFEPPRSSEFPSKFDKDD